MSEQWLISEGEIAINASLATNTTEGLASDPDLGAFSLAVGEDVLEISNLSHLLSSKIEQQRHEVGQRTSRIPAGRHALWPALMAAALHICRLTASALAVPPQVELLDQLTESTAENLVRGNAHIDAASKHSRDFRLVVLTFLFVATFSLLFLDAWYP